MAIRIRPVVFKIEESNDFVMNASNAIVTYTGSGDINVHVAWESPSYPDNYDGNGKQYLVTNNNTTVNVTLKSGLMYTASATDNGAAGIIKSDIDIVGTSTGTMVSNPVISSWGKYLTIAFAGTEEDVRAWLANVTITIFDA